MKGQWDEIVRNSRNGTFLHERGYMDYHSDRFTDCSLVALRDGKMCGLLPANIDGDTLWSHRGLTYGGWIVPLKHFDTTVMVEVMDAAIAWMQGNGLKRLVYKAVPHIYHRYPCEEDLYALFRHGSSLIETNISTTIDLTCPLPLDRGNKSGSNAARKAGIKTGQSDDWEGYWDLLSSLLGERYGTRPVHTLEEIKLLVGLKFRLICLRLCLCLFRCINRILFDRIITVLHVNTLLKVSVYVFILQNIKENCVNKVENKQ